jgi:SAM-dependent methyltransferase
MLGRVGADHEFIFSTPPIDLPADAEKYLNVENPRLAEIKGEYLRAVDTCGFPFESLDWCDDRISSDLPLKAFRGDCCYGWQKRDCNVPSAYILTWLYFCEIGLGPLLEKHSEDGLFGSFTVEYRGQKISRDLLDSVCEMSFIQKMLGNRSATRAVDILDIGSGYGRLAHRLSREEWVARTICTDGIPESTFLCEYYLKFRHADESSIVCTPFRIKEALERYRPQLAVNIHTFSTCTLKSVQWWAERLIEHRVPYLFIVPNAGDNEGRRLLTKEVDGRRVSYLEVLEQAGFELMEVVPKYAVQEIQAYGISPTHYYWFRSRKT